MTLLKEVGTEVANETLFDHIVNTGFSSGTAQFIKTVDAIANVATCHSNNQDFLWKNDIFTPHNNYVSQVYCANKGLFTALPTHNPVATAVKFIFVDTISISREKLFDMTPKSYWSHGFIGNTTNLVNTIGYGIGKIYGLGYNTIHDFLSFENSITKIYDTSKSFFDTYTNINREVYGPPYNPEVNREVYGPPYNPEVNREVYGPPYNPEVNRERFGLPNYNYNYSIIPFTERLLLTPNIQNIELPSRFVIDNGVGYRFDTSIILLRPNGVNYNTQVDSVNVNLSLDFGMINHLACVYIPTIIGNAPSTLIDLGNGTILTISYEMHGFSIYTTYTLDNPEKGIHITVNQYHNPNWNKELFLASHRIGTDKIGDLIINNIVNTSQMNSGNMNVIKLENGATHTISHEMHGISIYKTHTIDDPANGIRVGVSEYKNPNWLRDLNDKYNTAFANNYRHVNILIDGSSVTITKEVNGKIITNKIVIDNPQKGIHIEVKEKDDPKYQETAMNQYNSALRADTYINQCRLGKLIKTTEGLTPDKKQEHTNTFLEKTGEYTDIKIHLWTHKELFNNELTFNNALNIGMYTSYSLIFNIFRGKYTKHHNTKLQTFKELMKDTTIRYGENMTICTTMNHLFEEIKLLDLVPLETLGKIIPYASIGMLSLYQLCKIEFDSNHPYMKDNDINSFILNKILQTKIGILGKGFSSLITYFGLLEASSLWLIFGAGGLNFIGMIFFNWMVTKSISPYRDVSFAIASKINRLNTKIKKNIEIKNDFINLQENYNQKIKNYHKKILNISSRDEIENEKNRILEIYKKLDEKNFDFKVSCKNLEIEKGEISKFTDLILDKEIFIGNGFSYSFGGKF